MKKQTETNVNEKILGGGVKWYRENIVEMVGQIENEKYLKMIYGYVNSAYREEKSRV